MGSQALAADHPIKSLYTTVDLGNCKPQKAGPDENSWRCEGLPGFPLNVAYADERVFLSVGEAAGSQRAAQQSLHAFNTPFEAHTGRMTVEWRFVKRHGQALPYAMIVRYFTRNDEARGEVLVVIRVDGAVACHAAYIDAISNRDAIVLARRFADGPARTFDCGGAPVIEGRTGRSPM